MLIGFRTDASLEIGTGHVMRCLTLADELRVHGSQTLFFCRQQTGHLMELIAQRGHEVVALPKHTVRHATLKNVPTHAAWLGTDWETDARATGLALKNRLLDWMIVDHYSLDQHWEQALRPHCRKLMVIDDLADRSHDCDLLLDQNLGRQAEHYSGLLKRHTKTLIGPAYALLRPEFAQWRWYSLERRKNPQLKNLLITMGGVDKTNATGQVLDALTRCEIPADLRITVVMGPSAPWLAQVQVQATTMPRPTQVIASVNNMAQLMAESDLCIGAAGGTGLERCTLGLPTLVLILAANQHSGALALHSHGAAWVAADSQQLVFQMSALLSPDRQTEALREMSQSAAQLACGHGTSKVVELLMDPPHV